MNFEIGFLNISLWFFCGVGIYLGVEGIFYVLEVFKMFFGLVIRWQLFGLFGVLFDLEGFGDGYLYLYRGWMFNFLMGIFFMIEGFLFGKSLGMVLIGVVVMVIKFGINFFLFMVLKLIIICLIVLIMFRFMGMRLIRDWKNSKNFLVFFVVSLNLLLFSFKLDLGLGNFCFKILKLFGL